MSTACSQKTVFLTESQAKRACKRTWKHNFKRMYYYECDLCGNYHLTSEHPDDRERRLHKEEILEQSRRFWD